MFIRVLIQRHKKEDLHLTEYTEIDEMERYRNRQPFFIKKCQKYITQTKGDNIHDETITGVKGSLRSNIVRAYEQDGAKCFAFAGNNESHLYIENKDSIDFIYIKASRDQEPKIELINEMLKKSQTEIRP